MNNYREILLCVCVGIDVILIPPLISLKFNFSCPLEENPPTNPNYWIFNHYLNSHYGGWIGLVFYPTSCHPTMKSIPKRKALFFIVSCINILVQLLKHYQPSQLIAICFASLIQNIGPIYIASYISFLLFMHILLYFILL